MLNENQIVSNWEKRLQILETEYPDRNHVLLPMYKEMEERMIMMPASGVEHYHNAFPGGYVDHILRVRECAIELYNSWKKLGANVSGFTLQELCFTALHHDLGKTGFPGAGNETYMPNESEWHRKNQGKIYSHNTNNPFATIPDLSLYLLQYYNVPVSWNEYLAIKIHDGLYDDANKPYYISRAPEAKFKNCMPILLHHADHMASTIEYGFWKSSKADVNITEQKSVKSPMKKIVSPIADTKLKDAFEELFK